MEEPNKKRLVSEYCQREKLGRATYVCIPDKEPNPSGFYCTLTVSDKSYTSSILGRSKKAAEMEAAKLVCEKLSLVYTTSELKAQQQNTDAGDDIPAKRAKPEKPAIVKEPDWISIEKIEDIYGCLSEEVLAQQFVCFLNCKAQDEKKSPPDTSVEEADGKFTGTLTYDGVEYKSIGIMLTKKQAVQSAAEVCLRTLGEFPAVEKDKYTIQPYKGGRIPIGSGLRRAEAKDNRRVKSILLNYCTGQLCLQFPIYRYKESMEGEDKKYTAAVVFEGKLFESSVTSDSIPKAREGAAEEALQYLGFWEVAEAEKLRQLLRIKRRSGLASLGVHQSPLMFCPSKRPTWAFYHFLPHGEMTGEKFSCEDDTLGILGEVKKLESLTVEEILAEVMDVEPSFGGRKLSEITDLCIGEINNENKSHMIIGNNEFSFPIFCEDGKILSKKRKNQVKLLTGHKVRGLKCTYQLMYPSLQVYLKAESCDDLIFPKSPLPVLSACGAAMLIYDHEANTEDLHVLLTRSSDKKSFVTRARYVASYLRKQISSNPAVVSRSADFDIADCLENIAEWTHKEVQLMSEMTVESMQELMSPHIRYDDRWNEIFAGEHTDVLKELKAAAVVELNRRIEEDITEEEDSVPWMLPSTRFQHRLLTTGIFTENYTMCTSRSILHKTGLKIKLSDIDEVPAIDVPMEDDANSHRGDVCRYLIWTGLRKVSSNDEEPYYKNLSIDEKLEELGYEDNKSEGGNRKRTRQEGRRQEKKEYRGGEENKTADVKEEPNGDAPKPMEEDKPKKPEGRQSRNAEQQGVHDECRWFPLEEAKSLCATLMELSEDPIFEGQVQALQLEANEFENAKTEANGV